MRVNIKRFYNLPILILLCTLLFTEFLFLPKPVRAATLIGAADYIADDSLSATGIVHNVSFVIPMNGHAIVATDYIRIILTNFSAVTAPTSGSGWSGVPTYGVSSNVAWLTGVTAPVGAGIMIGGITATNPASPSDFDVTIQVANDVSGSIVYDSATVTAQSLKETLTARVSVGTETSSVEFFGYTSPRAFVTILLNGGVAATDTANSGGNFHKKLTGLEQDMNYSVSIFAQDTKLRQSQTVSFIVHTLPFTNHIYSNIVLPTTIALDETVIYQGDILTIRGRAHPLSSVSVFVEGNSYSSVVKVPTNGFWAYDFDSMVKTLSPGTHIAYAREVVVGGYQSIFTQSLNFVVKECKIADLNCDGFVNLTDFSILMYYWEQTNPVNKRADINNDSLVNLTDFSIMMFYWTG